MKGYCFLIESNEKGLIFLAIIWIHKWKTLEFLFIKNKIDCYSIQDGQIAYGTMQELSVPM